MKLIEQIERINRLHELIKYRRTGTPEQLAKRLNLSTSMIYKLMEELRLREAPIEYSRQLKTYYYSSRYLMHIEMDFRLLHDEEIIEYRGGTVYGYHYDNSLPFASYYSTLIGFSNILYFY